MKLIKSTLLMACVALALMATVHANPLKRFNFSVWTDYTDMKFKGLTQEEKTEKLQALFKDKVNFAKSYNARRVMVKILNPSEFDFFKTENYDATRDDNFYYWAMELSQYAELEAVFDIGSFNAGNQGWKDNLIGYACDWFGVERPLGDFRDIKEKLSWVSFMNQMENPNGKRKYVVRGVTIDPQGLDDGFLQLVINVLDQYKYNASEDLPHNPYPNVRMGAYLTLDQRDLAYCNLSRFPLRTDLRGQKPNDIEISAPDNFPSEGPEYTAPEWRKVLNSPLLDTVYLKMGDKRLIENVYQNLSQVPNPSQYNSAAAVNLSLELAKSMRGAPTVKGPGYISCRKGSSDVSGRYTFFRTGGGKYQQGQVLEGATIEVRPPYLSHSVRKSIGEQPENNKGIRVTSTFSTTEDVKEAEYYVCATPVDWSKPKTSNFIRSKIYYVFSMDFQPDEGRFFGNWCLENFLDFLHVNQRNPKHQKGFLTQLLFMDISGNWASPVNNLVLHDFTAIPNGAPYPECDWKLGNQNHY